MAIPVEAWPVITALGGAGITGLCMLKKGYNDNKSAEKGSVTEFAAKLSEELDKKRELIEKIGILQQTINEQQSTIEQQEKKEAWYISQIDELKGKLKVAEEQIQTLLAGRTAEG